MKGSTGQGASTLMNVVEQIGKVTRFMANTVTTWNPEFMFGNFQRDIQEAMLNARQFEIPDLSKKVFQHAFPAMKAVWNESGEINWKYLSGKGQDGKGKWYDHGEPSKLTQERFDAMTPEQQRYINYHRDFLADGGSIASMGLRDLADTLSKVNTQLRAADSQTNFEKLKAPVKRLGNVIEAYNRVVENATRLSVYISLREALEKQIKEKHGDSRPDLMREARDIAAQASKNMTANFNRGGEWKPFVNSLYMFYNASIQGSFSMVSAASRSPWVRNTIGAAIAAGFVQDAMMSQLSETDTDGTKVYDKIPDWLLEHKMVFLDPFGMTDKGYFEWAMPYGYSSFYNFGRSTSRYMRGDTRLAKLLVVVPEEL
jgi:hypothetical protein